MAILHPDAEKVVRTHGQETYPYECCGFLYGKETEDGREILKAVRADNDQEDNQERRFQISPKQYMHAERKAAELGLDLLGIYHSHPDHPARPSEHDRKQAMPFFSYFIVSVQKGEARQLTSWVLNPEFQFEEEDIKILENIKS
jgi:proteasome lid subunit RPN8/RPN11